MRPAARLLDRLVCFRPCKKGKIFLTHNITTFINNLPAACLGDKTDNCAIGKGCWFPNVIITGSFSTFVNNRPAARLLDKDISGLIITGSFDTFIG